LGMSPSSLGLPVFPVFATRNMNLSYNVAVLPFDHKVSWSG